MRRGWNAFIAASSAWILLCGFAGADENYVHALTGFTFPPKVADFSRAHITAYNKEKSDIEVDYDNHPYTVHASVYVYPARDPLEKHYMKCKFDVMEVHPDATSLGEKPVTLTKGGVNFDGFSASYKFRGSFVNATPTDLLSKLMVFRRGDFYVLYRISYAESDRDQAERQIDEFIKKLDWPPGDGTAAPAK